MSRTRDRLYAQGFRAGRRLTRWEKIRWFFCRQRAEIEDWITDDDSSDMDFLVLLFAGIAIALAGIAIWATV